MNESSEITEEIKSVISCGDFRAISCIQEYLKWKLNICKPDILTTAGGSKTISLYNVCCDADEEENLSLEFKNRSLWMDFEKYLSHGAKIIVVADHSDCGAWEKFQDEIEEERRHRESLQRARKIISEKYKQVEKVILLYVVLDEAGCSREIKIVS